MRKSALIFAALATSLLVAAPASAGPAEDATATVTTWLDKFNAGDVAAFHAAHASNAVIVDEFSPHLWTGPDASKRWLNDYMKDSKAKGISGGRIDYGKPLQAASDGTKAYVVLPTTYRFVQNGKKMAGAGSMAFVMTKAGKDWKIASWTYSGATWAPEKPASAETPPPKN
jgi:ketosteroid isomerase-like protein